MLRLIGTDIDGTLVEDGTHNLNPEYFEVIRQLTDAGVTFCVCSGRQYKVMREMFAPVADRIYFICENGSALRTSEKMLHQWVVDPQKVPAILEDICKIPGTVPLLCKPDVTYVQGTEEVEPYPLLRNGYHYSVECVDDITSVSPENVSKVTIYSDGSAEELAADFVNSHWSREFLVNCSGLHWIDLCAREGGKGQAFALLQTLLGIDQEQTLYFGDNMNDLPAFAETGIAATVANARSEVRERADLIARSYREDGVLHALREILGSLV